MKSVHLILASAAVVALAACQTTGGYEPVAEVLPKLTVSFADAAWDGKAVPKGQQCSKFSGAGGTPALIVDGVPEGANAIIVEFNDRSYAPLSANGGHGKIGFWVKGGGAATLASVPGEKSELPEGSFLEARNRATGSFARPGYLPPCSGGKGNAYFAEVKAVYKGKTEAEKGKLLAVGAIELGRY